MTQLNIFDRPQPQGLAAWLPTGPVEWIDAVAINDARRKSMDEWARTHNGQVAR